MLVSAVATAGDFPFWATMGRGGKREKGTVTASSRKRKARELACLTSDSKIDGKSQSPQRGKKAKSRITQSIVGKHIEREGSAGR